MVRLSGKAFYVGYLKGCTVYADLNGDLVQDEGEPTSTTDEYGGWILDVQETAQGNAEVIVPASPDCIDRSTSLPLVMPLRSPVGCEVASMLSEPTLTQTLALTLTPILTLILPLTLTPILSLTLTLTLTLTPTLPRWPPFYRTSSTPSARPTSLRVCPRRRPPPQPTARSPTPWLDPNPYPNPDPDPNPNPNQARSPTPWVSPTSLASTCAPSTLSHSSGVRERV